MSRRLVVLVALLALAAPAAEAKGPPGSVSVCGARGLCVTVAGAEAQRLALWDITREVAPAKPAPYYTVYFRWSDSARQETLYWLPTLGLARTTTQAVARWYTVAEGGRGAVAARLAPTAPPRITRATVAGRRVRAPQTYLQLFRAGRKVSIFPAVNSWLPLRLHATVPSPWTDGSANLRISSTGGYLLRDDTVFAIPGRLADRARRGLPLTG